MNELEPPLSRVWHQEGCSLGRSEVIKALMKKTESKRARCWPCLRELEPVWGSQGRRPSVSRYGTQSRRIGRKPFQPGSGVCICGNHAPSTAIQGPGASYLGLTSLEMSVKLNLRHWVCPDHLSWITLTKINQASSHMSGGQGVDILVQLKEMLFHSLIHSSTFFGDFLMPGTKDHSSEQPF